MLHITNGESVSLAEAGMSGDIVFWNDVLHEGPVPPLPLDELSQLRAGFVAQAWAEPEEDVRRSFDRRDTALKKFRDHDEVVLWFEHDLYDQLQLIQILDYLGSHPRGGTRVSLIQSGTYLGPMDPQHLAALFPSRREVRADQFATAQRAWAAFRAPAPAGLVALAESDTGRSVRSSRLSPPARPPSAMRFVLPGKSRCSWATLRSSATFMTCRPAASPCSKSPSGAAQWTRNCD